MKPEELAALHPCLYHVTRPDALSSIKTHGLLSTSRLLTLFDIPSAQRLPLESQRRPTSIRITHPVHGKATLTDNVPLSDVALSKCLEDGLLPQDWMRLLNQRVFFWVDEQTVDRHLNAGVRLGEDRVVLVLDTLSVVRAHHKLVELAPINTGATLRRPARRGLSTFAPAHQYAYREWQKLRGKRDRIKELTVIDGIPDIAQHVIGCYDASSHWCGPSEDFAYFR